MDGFHYEELTEGSYPGFLLGVRAFTVQSGRPIKKYSVLYEQSPTYEYEVEIHSPAQHHIWTPGVNTARCLRQLTFFYGNGPSFYDRYDHAAPEKGCHCGFYAYGRTEYAAEFAHYSSQSVIGVVKATGRIIVGDKGMRAQKMEIAGLINPTSRQQLTHSSMGNEAVERDYEWFTQSRAERVKWRSNSLNDDASLRAGRDILKQSRQPYPWFDSIEEAVETIRKVT